MLGGESYERAQIYLSFASDVSKVEAFSDANAAGFLNRHGKARVTIITGKRVLVAELHPDQ